MTGALKLELKHVHANVAGHPSSVDALVAFDEDTVLTGSQDGLIRVISILPNRMLGVVGEHGDFPVEALALSHDRCVCSLTEMSSLWVLLPSTCGAHFPVEALALSHDRCISSLTELASLWVLLPS